MLRARAKGNYEYDIEISHRVAPAQSNICRSNNSARMIATCRYLTSEKSGAIHESDVQAAGNTHASPYQICGHGNRSCIAEAPANQSIGCRQNPAGMICTSRSLHIYAHSMRTTQLATATESPSSRFGRMERLVVHSCMQACAQAAPSKLPPPPPWLPCQNGGRLCIQA